MRPGKEQRESAGSTVPITLAIVACQDSLLPLFAPNILHTVAAATTYLGFPQVTKGRITEMKPACLKPSDRKARLGFSLRTPCKLTNHTGNRGG